MAKQLQSADDFSLAIIFRIEGRNSRAMLLRVVGGIVALAVILGKLLTLFPGKAP